MSESLRIHSNKYCNLIMITSKIDLQENEEQNTKKVMDNLKSTLDMIKEMELIDQPHENEIDLIPDTILSAFEKITNKTQNIMIHHYIVRMVEIVFRNKWYTTSNKNIWTLIYLINFMFDMHDIFTGSFLSLRLVRISKAILMGILENRGSQINQEQSYQINSLLNTEAI